jgi:DNA-binding transcriptional LysR family regulator
MADIDLRDLDAFVAVARTRNFRRAAVEQRVSVSSLSQRLRDLEERLCSSDEPHHPQRRTDRGR